MEALDIELALRIYRQLGDAAMVLGLEKAMQPEKTEEEKAKAQTEAEFGLDPDMAAMMGFSGFGGPN